MVPVSPERSMERYRVAIVTAACLLNVRAEKGVHQWG